MSTVYGEEPLRFDYDESSDILNIEGIKYPVPFFAISDSRRSVRNSR